LLFKTGVTIFAETLISTGFPLNKIAAQTKVYLILQVLFMNKEIATKTGDRPLLILTSVLLFLSIVCLIVNYSIDQSITWALYPTGALIVIWATIAPLLLLKKNKAVGTISGFAITVIAYLFLIQYLATTKDWVIPLALPIVILAIAALGICLLLFTYLKMNNLHKAAAAVLVFGVIANFGVGKIVDNFLDEKNVDDIARTSTISTSAILALILFVIGLMKRSKTT